MKQAEQLRERANELEEKMQFLINEFIEDVGACDVKIDTNCIYKTLAGKRVFVNSKVDVNITL